MVSYHAALLLSQVAATAVNSDYREWAEVAGRRFGSHRSAVTSPKTSLGSA
jgi:hypothetical protein